MYRVQHTESRFDFEMIIDKVLLYANAVEILCTVSLDHTHCVMRVPLYLVHTAPPTVGRAGQAGRGGVLLAMSS